MGLDRHTRFQCHFYSTEYGLFIVVQNRPHELAAHVRGAVNNGLSRAEIKEILLQVGIYCGVPAMVDSFRIAKTVLDELEAE